MLSPKFLPLCLLLALCVLPGWAQSPRFLDVEVIDQEEVPAVADVLLVPMEGTATRRPSGRFPILWRHGPAVWPMPDTARGQAGRTARENGRVRLPMPVAEEWLLVARGPGTAACLIVTAKGDELVHEVGPLKLEPVHSVFVRVADGADRGIEGATVLLLNADRKPGPPGVFEGVVEDTAAYPKGVTGPQGEVEFLLVLRDGARPPERFEARVLRHGGEAVVTTAERKDRGSRLTCTLTDNVSLRFLPLVQGKMAPTERLHVEWERLEGGRGTYRPDKLGMIHVSWNFDAVTAQTDWYHFGSIWYAEMPATGRVQAGFVAGQSFGMTVEVPGRMGAVSQFTVPEGPGPHDLVVPVGARKGCLHFRVTAPKGKPWPGGSLRPHLPDEEREGLYYCNEMELVEGFDLNRSDDGVYTLLVPPGKPLHFGLRTSTAWRLEYDEAPWKFSRALEPLAPGERRDLGTLELVPDPIFVAGEVVDADGKPIAGVRLELKSGKTGEGPGLEAEMTTDAAGHFVVRAPRVTEREHLLRARLGDRRADWRAVQPGETTIRVVLP